MKRTLAVGDIHGGFKALEQVLDRAEVTTDDTLIFLGDYVDGWSQVYEVIEKLISLKESNNCIFIRGNHDAWCEEWLKIGIAKPDWLSNGGYTTYESYMNQCAGIVPTSHREFFYKLDNYYLDDKNRGFVHGGFKSRKGLGHEVHLADYYWDRDMWGMAVLNHDRIHLDEDGVPQFCRFLKHEEIFIGHTTTRMWKNKPHYPEFDGTNSPITVPMNRCNVWNLDTGGGWGGKLTIMDIDTKEYWQSDFVKDLYPDEKGR